MAIRGYELPIFLKPLFYFLLVSISGLLIPSELNAQWTATTSNLTVARGFLSAVTLGDNAIFAGGATDNLPSDKVDIYNNISNTWQTGSLSLPRYRMGAAIVTNKSIFGGGQNQNNPVSNVDFFDFNAQYQGASSLPMGKVDLTASSVGNKAFFAGGVEVVNSNLSQTIDVYDNTSNTWSLLSMTERKASMASVSNGAMVFFAGGTKATGKSDVVEIYDTSNNTWSYASLSQARSDLVAIAVGSKVLFAGGYPSSPGDSDVVDIYDINTNVWTTATLSVGRFQLAAASVNGKVFFGGGNRKSGGPVDVVDIYDYNTDTWSTTTLSQSRYGLAAAAVGNKVIFAGGFTPGPSGYVASDVVDIYEVAKLAITTFSPSSGTIGTTVTIEGSGYSSTPTNNIVYFGATKATVTSATSTQLTVTVPVGATYQPFTVTVNGLTAYSSKPFTVTFPSNRFIDAATFAPKVDFTNGPDRSPYDVAIGDLDGDGKTDMIVSNAGGTVSVFRNTSVAGTISSASFSTNVDFATMPSPRGVAIGDLDGDGKLDFAVANASDNTVSVYRNTSTTGSINSSSFAPKVDFATGNYSYFVAIADFDLDGKPDLVVTNGNSNTVSVLRNKSNIGEINLSSFETQIEFATGLTPFHVAATDLDDDNRPDIVVTNLNSSSISVLHNTTSAGIINSNSFAPKVNFATGVSPFGIAIADFDGDEKSDLAIANTDNNTISFLRNISTSGAITPSSFETKFDLTSGYNAYHLAVTDLDGDGKPELVSANNVGNSISVFKNQTSSGPFTASSFSPNVNFNTGPVPYSVAIGDFDGDGKPDLVTPNFSSGGSPGHESASVLRNQIGLPRPTIASFSPEAGKIGSQVIITGSNFDSTPLNNKVYFGGTKAIVTAATFSQLTVTVPKGATYQPITVVANGLMAYSSKPFVVTFSSNGILDANSFTPKFDYATGNNPRGVAIGDLNNDEKPDLVVTNAGSNNSIRVFQNSSTIGTIDQISFGNYIDFAAGSGPYGAAIGDLDCDGKLDVAVVNYTSSTVTLFRNTGAVGFITSNLFELLGEITTGTSPLAIAIGDLDLDGKPDLAVANASGTVSLFRNNSVTGATLSLSAFPGRVNFTCGNDPYDVAIGDIDGDQMPDLVVSNGGSSTVSVFKNKSTPGTINSNSFAPKVDFATGSGPFGVAIGDLDNDDKPDLSVSNESERSISVLKNISSLGVIASNSFATKVDFTTGLTPASIDLCDLNGDGKIDMITPNQSTYNFSVFKNVTSTGVISGSSFSPKVDFTTGINPYRLAVGDLDGDDKPDVVISNSGSGNSISVFRNKLVSVIVAIASFTPGSGIVGTSVIITGTNFDPVPSNNIVKFNGTTAVVTASTTTSITTSVPLGATTGPITVTAYDQKATSASNFTVLPVPTILSFTPSSGVIGTSVTITGTNFDPVPSNNIIKFNGTSANVTASSSSNITTTVPMGATTGPITITVNGQTATSASNFTVILVPTISSFYPGSGVVGNHVTIYGTNFGILSENTLKFNGTAAVIATSNATTLTTYVPAGATTGPITVTVNGQTATSSSNFVVIQPIVVIITSESFPATYDQGGSLTLSITVNDTTNISLVNLKTRGITEPLSAQKTFSVTRIGTKYEKTISSAELTDAIGLTYYFEVNTISGQGVIQSTRGTTRIKYPSSSSEQVIPNMSFGNQVKDYQIISIPLELTNKNGSAVFSALGTYDIKKWRLFDYSPSKGDYIEYPGGFNTINIGKAYWLIVRNSITINPGEGVTANVTDSSPFIINLAAGWNLIGNPYNFRISWSEVMRGNNNPVGVGKLKVFSNASLEESNTLDRYRGGFVFADAPFALEIPVLRNTSLGGRIGNIQQLNPLDHTDWDVNLILSDGELSNHLGGIGMNLSAQLVGKDQFDEVSLPLPNGLGLFELSFPHPEVFSTFSKEIVPSQESYTWNFDIDRLEGTDLTMSWRNDYFGTNDKQLMLFNPSTQELVDMKKKNNFSLSSTTQQLRILYGSDKYIQHALDKELPWLGNTYPNPAHEELTIPFRVPETYDQMPVTIRIYNSQGIEVGTPVNHTMGKGAYEVKWNPQGQTGLHIIRMRIGQEETKAIKAVFK